MSNVKKGLGRGLSALIKDGAGLDLNVVKKEIIELDIDKIRTNKNQPRQDFNQESLKELSSSIKEFGVLQPILVRKIEDTETYEIVAGERRYRASVKAKKESIPAIIVDIDEVEQAKIAIIENIQRENLSPIEESKAYKSLIDTYKLTQKELSETLGKSRSYIANSMRLLNLDKEVLKDLENEKISIGHGKVLLGLDKVEQSRVAKQIIEDGLNVRQTEELVKKVKNIKPNDSKKETKIKKMENDPYMEDFKLELMNLLGTKVDIKDNGKIKKIEIEYYSNEDLDRIYEIIKK